MDTPIIWPGGKRSNLPLYRHLFPPTIQRIREPFAGGAAASFALVGELSPLALDPIVLGDVNTSLVSFYETLRDHVEEVIIAWESYLTYHEPEFYYSMREIHPDDLTPIERAGWFFYLNHTCYNGLWRENASGRMNTPIGDIHRVEEPLLRQASAALMHATVRFGDFEDTLFQPLANGDTGTYRSVIIPGDFVLLDPPYQPISKTASFKSYSALGWNDADDVRVHRAMLRLTDMGANVMLASSAVESVFGLYSRDSQWRIFRIKSRRSISAKPTSRGKVEEYVILNYEPNLPPDGVDGIERVVIESAAEIILEA